MITNGQLTVGTAATAIDGVATNPTRITIQNLDNTDTLYVGNDSVTINNGLGILKLETLQIELAPLEQLYVVSSKAGHRLSWLRNTV